MQDYLKKKRWFDIVIVFITVNIPRDTSVTVTEHIHDVTFPNMKCLHTAVNSPVESAIPNSEL